MKNRNVPIFFSGLLAAAAFLGVRSLALRLGELVAPPAPAQISGTLDWWPDQLDPAMLQRIAQEQPGLAVAMSFLSVLFGGLLLGGFALSLWAVWTGHAQSLWRFAHRRLPPWSLNDLGRVLVLILALVVFMPLLRPYLLPGKGPVDLHAWMAVSMTLLDLLVILMIATFSASKGWPLWRLFALTRRRCGTTLGAGLRAYVSVFPWLFVALFLMVEASRRLGWHPPAEPIQELLFHERRAGMVALTAGLACLVAPLAEELFFRGVLYAALRQRLGWIWAMVLSGAAFALVHTNVLGFLPIFALGCLLANLYERTGSLAVPVIVHMLHNGLLMSVALVLRQLLLASGS